MVKIWRLLIAALATAALAGCAGPLRQKLEPENKVCGTPPCAALAAVYTTTHFQERWLAKVIVGRIIGGAVGGAIEASGQGAQTPANVARIDVNEFEKKLGSFDTTQYLAQSLASRLGTVRPIEIKVVDDAATVATIQTQVRSTSGWSSNVVDTKTGAKTNNVAAFAVKYGMGARVGNEQMGFRKSYRPYVHVVGQVRNLPTGKLVWADQVLVFGPTRYLGSAADPEKVDADELRTTLRNLSNEAVALIVQSLNGEQLPEMPQLVDENATDWEF